MSLLQLPLGPLELFLEHGHLPAQILSRRLVGLSLVCPRLVRVQPGLGLVQAALGDLELTLERGDVLLLLEDGLFELSCHIPKSAIVSADSVGDECKRAGSRSCWPLQPRRHASQRLRPWH